MKELFQTDIQLAGGRLEITASCGRSLLESLCGYASRQNKRRRFLFVSKVLGKHWPVLPSRMRDIYQQLATDLVELEGPVVMIGMAETATGLAQGVYDSLIRAGARTDTLFLHTTRYHSSRHRLAFEFEEAHSHATEQLLYLPQDAAAQLIFHEARSVVIVDDEISTGNTMANLVLEYHKLNPDLRSVRFVSITDWLGERQDELRQRCSPLEVEFVNVLAGTFTFEPDEIFEIKNEVNVVGNAGCKDFCLPVNWGRFGVQGLPAVDFAPYEASCGLTPGCTVLVLGSGEFSYPPFLFAEYLEEKGYLVHFQSSTRSPIMLGNDIGVRLEFRDNYWDDIPNFIYNVKPERYDRIVACYETPILPAGHNLPELLAAVPLVFHERS